MGGWGSVRFVEGEADKDGRFAWGIDRRWACEMGEEVVVGWGSSSEEEREKDTDFEGRIAV